MPTSRTLFFVLTLLITVHLSESCSYEGEWYLKTTTSSTDNSLSLTEKHTLWLFTPPSTPQFFSLTQLITGTNSSGVEVSPPCKLIFTGDWTYLPSASALVLTVNHCTINGSCSSLPGVRCSTSQYNITLQTDSDCKTLTLVGAGFSYVFTSATLSKGTIWLITSLSTLGFIAVLVGSVWLYKRRQHHHHHHQTEFH